MQQYLRNVRLLYIYWFFHSLIFAYVIERLFNQDRGLNIQQMVYIEIIYAVVVLVLEVPTGAIADRWSRKKMMILSSFCIFFEFLFLIYAYSFWMFVLSALAAAIGGALASGTDKAIFYDSLKIVDKQDQYEKVIARNHFFENTAGMTAAVVGGFTAAQFGLVFNYWISLVGVTIAFGVTFLLTDLPKTTSTKETQFWQHIAEAFQFLRGQAVIQFILLYGIVIAATWLYIDEYWQIYLNSIAVPIALFGFYSVGSQFFDSIGGLVAHRIKRRVSYRAMFSFLIILSAVCVLAASVYTNWIGITLLLGMHIVFGVSQPLVSGYLHHRTESHHRATVDSFQSLGMRGATILIGLLFGYIATRFDIFTGFRFIGGVLALYAVCFCLFQFRFLTHEKYSA